MKISKTLLLVIFLPLMACGDSQDGNKRNLTAVEVAPDPEEPAEPVIEEPELPSHTQSVQARAGFQEFAFEVEEGDRITIESTGLWSGGQLDENGDNLFCGAGGCNGLDTNGQPKELGFEEIMCGIKPKHAPAGASVPADNHGLCCSNQRRIIDFQGTAPNRVVEANECLPIKKNVLIMKIVPVEDIANHSNYEPIEVGTFFERTPYRVKTNGVLMFANNDTVGGLHDNAGALNVTVTKR